MNDLLITIDIDWAPDFAIDFVAEWLISYSVCATWFVTHLSPAVERLRQCPELFELGIHPNFLPGSTHGDTPDTVLRHCMALVPEAQSGRMHCLVQSTSLLATILAETPILIDVNLFLPYTSGLRPVEYHWDGRRLLRIPYFWEDGYEMGMPIPSWHLTPQLMNTEGLKVFNFHPINVYLNSANKKPYQAIKRHVPKLDEATRAEVDAYVQTGEGTQTMFMELASHLAIARQSLCIRDLYKRWRLLKGEVKQTRP